MKSSVLVSFVVVLILCSCERFGQVTLKIGHPYQQGLVQNYPIECEGVEEKLSYRVFGLPDGAQIKGNEIQVSSKVRPGNYLIRVQGLNLEDEIIVERVIPLHIVLIQGGLYQRESNPATEQLVSKSVQNEKLASVINSYSAFPNIQKTYTYENNRYPEAQLPTGSSPSAINLTPYQIQNSISSPSSQNRDYDSGDDVVLRAASERHQNSVKAITNLLKIIDQARANSANAQAQLEIYVRAYNDAINLQRKTQNNIITLETRKTQIYSAIQGASEKIQELKTEIVSLQNSRRQKNRDKQFLLSRINGEQNTKAQLMMELTKVNKEIAGYMKQLTLIEENLTEIQTIIHRLQKDLESAIQEYETLMERRKNFENVVFEKAEKVRDLQAQLAKAEQELTDAEISLADIFDQEKKLPLKITGIEDDIEKYIEELGHHESQRKKLSTLVDAIAVNDMIIQIQDLEQGILALRIKVMETDEDLSYSLQPLENLKNKLEGAQNDLSYLKTQVRHVEAQLNEAFIEGNDANTLVSHAKENLNAVNTRYIEEEKKISTATLNLERARAEEALARLALEEIIAHFSNALPYAIVPIGDGATDAGIPAGNNPSGSPLGPTDDQITEPSFPITSWVHYLSQAFGDGVHPKYTGIVNRLYGFEYLSQPNIRSSDRNGVCGGNGPVRATSGRVTSINDNQFTIELNSGDRFVINVGSCTQMNANVPNYKMTAGDEVILKGVQRHPQKIQASQVTCLRY